MLAGEVGTGETLRLQNAGGDLDSNPVFSSEAVATVFRHSGGLPRLINTICDNAPITVYARQLPSVTLDNIEDVAKEFRLDALASLEATTTENPNEMSIEQVANPHHDLYATLKRTMASESDLGRSLTRSEQT